MERCANSAGMTPMHLFDMKFRKNVVAGGGPATLGGVLLRVFSLEIIISGNNEANMN